MTSRRLRRVRVAGAILLAIPVAWVLVGLRLFVFPVTDPVPHHADVVLVLGDQTPQRMAVAERLLHDGVVDRMLWSTPKNAEGIIQPALLAACRSTAHLTCFDPSPRTTQGEARELGTQAKEHGWTSAIVVTQSAHIWRARMIVDRCFAGRVAMVSSGEPPEGGWTFQYLYQTSATVKMLLAPGC